MADDDPGQSRSAATTTAVAEPPARRGLRQIHPVVIVLVAVGLAALLGWVFAGFPGIRASGSVSVVLLVVAAVSGTLTLIFVVDAVRKTRSRKRMSAGEMRAVVASGLVTGLVSLIQLVQTALQLARH